MRVLVCGGRDYTDRALVFQILDLLKPTAVITGGAEGADEYAHSWATAMEVERPRFYADWKAFGKPAGPIRNQRMLVEGKPDLVVAFPGGRGTADLVRRARKMGAPVLAVVPPIYWDKDKPSKGQKARPEVELLTP